MVVVVNAYPSVDNIRFAHIINGLRAEQALEQDWYPGWSKTGQKSRLGQTLRFHTFAPVDMQGLVHKGFDVDVWPCESGCCQTGV
jgi:hypothetical protein